MKLISFKCTNIEIIKEVQLNGDKVTKLLKMHTADQPEPNCGDAVSNPSSLDPREFNDDQFAEVQQAVLSGKVSTVVPMEIARRNGNNQVREELLLKTDVNKEEGSVFWHGLRLLSLDISWLRRISWVKHLRLARNGIKSLPQEMGTYLKQVGAYRV